MKNKAYGLIAAVLCAGILLTGCGGDTKPETSTSQESSVVETTPESSAPESSESDTGAATDIQFTDSSAPDGTESSASSETESSAQTESSAASESSSPAENSKADKETDKKAASGKYVDLDNMQFSINGKTYTLGKTTLQDLIDDGVPFDEDDLANANNNLNKNSQSQGFKINLGEYWSAQVYAMNDTDENKTTAECYIGEVYLPLHDDETQDILTFAFPQNITMDELKKNAGEPTDTSHYDGDDGYYTDTLEYTRKSTKYIGDSGYKFEFTNGQLRYITIEYLP